MINKIKLAAALCISSLVLLNASPVLAAEGTEITLQADCAEEGGSQIQLACQITGGGNVTNGKLRIRYDSSKVSLTASSAGSVLSGALCEINDCLTGNKPEGEIVAAFASSGSLYDEGNLMDMTFQVSQEVKAGDTLDFSVDPEELSGDNGDISLEPCSFTVTVKEKGVNTPPEPDKKPGTTLPDDETGNSDGEQGLSEKTTGTTPKMATNTASKTASKTVSVKTGDSTNVLFPVGGLCAAALILAALGRKSSFQTKRGHDKV